MFKEAKIVRVGTIEENGRNADIFCHISYKSSNLSISGVVGPKRNGDCLGGCGQIEMSFKHRNSTDSSLIDPSKITFAPSWNKELWLDFLDVWKKWHLNDMRAGCEHQMAENWGKKQLTIVRVGYHISKLNRDENYEDIISTFEAIEKCYDNRLPVPEFVINSCSHVACKAYICAVNCALRGEVFSPSEENEFCPYIGKGRLISITTETKFSSWVYPKTHPEGVLTKPCPVCRYKYGTAWTREDVPSSVIDFIDSLPDTDKIPAWI